jgi:hypothetical protein
MGFEQRFNVGVWDPALGVGDPLEVEDHSGLQSALPAISHKGGITSNPDGLLMDSEPIAMYIDKLYPSSVRVRIKYSRPRSSSPEGTLGITSDTILGLIKLTIFCTTRTEAFGKPLSEVKPTDEAELLALWQLIENETDPGHAHPVQREHWE